ncbi:MAG: hypothetical protein LKJ17_12575 [Oscillospiraceae bacterium]|nr:hypothetical protein [Oscillospiraceae bacterium]
MLKIELSRAFQGKNFIITIILGSIITMVHFILYALPMAVPEGVTAQNYGGLYPPTVFNEWIGGQGLFLTATLYFFLLPLMAAIPYGDSYYLEKKSGYPKNIFLRTNKKYYFISKYIAVFLSAGTAITIPLLLNLLVTMAMFPSVLPDINAPVFMMNPSCMWSSMFYAAPYGYIFCYLLLDFVFSGLLATISLVAGLWMRHHLGVLLAPFLFFLIIYFTLNFMSIYFRFLNTLNPGAFLNPTPVIDGITLPPILLEMLLLFCATFFVYIKEGVRREVF